ncbi:hypothetical protein M878_09965 [Streptomyces roseochromogenus subsp. oscitans DS 12.976]|uniref:Uncharacterized protein n=1 Tax=Streptomyces roseochromogenus subsp. oscitans DS 12.976 TaxID=1352936 RepID=V6KQY4_STRRC|nr:hypothetical protein M878_09965 [Streptomyces roseochromogenus subsp. oscitans DS 12.976]
MDYTCRHFQHDFCTTQHYPCTTQHYPTAVPGRIRFTA